MGKYKPRCEYNYVIKFDNNRYWKGQGGRLTRFLRSASFLREIDISGKNLVFIINKIKKLHPNIVHYKIIKVHFEEEIVFNSDLSEKYKLKD